MSEVPGRAMTLIHTAIEHGWNVTVRAGGTDPNDPDTLNIIGLRGPGVWGIKNRQTFLAGWTDGKFRGARVGTATGWTLRDLTNYVTDSDEEFSAAPAIKIERADDE